MKYKEIVYMVLDELKINSDDSFFTEDHIIFLASKYRNFLLKQRYADVRKPIPDSNYQTICLDLIKVPAVIGEPCCCGVSLRSKEKIPFFMKIVNPSVYPINYYQGNIIFVSRDRMKYVGYNKYMQNIIYASLGPDNYLYFKSLNPHYLHLEKIKMTAIFEDPQTITKQQMQCEEDDTTSACTDVLDTTFPIEDALVPQLIQLIVEELTKSEYKPEDKINNASDDLSEAVTNSKS